MEQTVMLLDELKDKYPDEWFLVEVIESDEEGQPTQVKLIEHSPDRDDTYDALTQVEVGKRVHHFFNGAIPKAGVRIRSSGHLSSGSDSEPANAPRLLTRHAPLVDNPSGV